MKNIFFTIVDEKEFNYITYKNILDEIDYYLYLGHDEGSMSFLDAVFFNKKIIAIPQGFQYDLRKFIQFTIYDANDLRIVFVKLCDEIKQLILFNENNSWINYVDKIVEIANSKRNATRIIKEFEFIKKIRYIILKKYYVKQFKQSQSSRLSCDFLQRKLRSILNS
jgi:5'-deoxynucleotidase YfbR-like HD superfamily hydrolase